MCGLIELSNLDLNHIVTLSNIKIMFLFENKQVKETLFAIKSWH